MHRPASRAKIIQLGGCRHQHNIQHRLPYLQAVNHQQTPPELSPKHELSQTTKATPRNWRHPFRAVIKPDFFSHLNAFCAGGLEAPKGKVHSVHQLAKTEYQPSKDATLILLKCPITSKVVGAKIVPDAHAGLARTTPFYGEGLYQTYAGHHINSPRPAPRAAAHQ